MVTAGGFCLGERYIRLVLRCLRTREDVRLHGIRECIESVLDHGIPGDFIVTGDRQGAATVLARALPAAGGDADRWVWVASPLGSWRDLDGIRDALMQCDLLDDAIHFVAGPMWDAVPVAPIEQLAMLHLDAGTGDAVEHLLGNLYPRLAAGGFVVVDEFGTSVQCREAVERFRNAHAVTSHLRPLGASCVAWRKEHA